MSSSPKHPLFDAYVEACNYPGKLDEQTLKRRGKLWFTPDETMYVYYTPTHWRYADA